MKESTIGSAHSLNQINQTASGSAVEVIDLHKTFESNKVLKGVSLDACQGDVIAVIGGSGSGKSTLLRCINLLETPTSGTIKIHGEKIALKNDGKGSLKPVRPSQVRRVRTRLAMVFQNFNLWQHMTLLENVIEVPMHVLSQSKSEAVDSAEKLLHRVDLYDKKDAYPAFLSGGQQQRAAIARALAIEPEVMLFDEPTSALDPELIGEVLSVISDLAKEGRTMILVTHEMKFAREVADKIVFLNHGIIEEQGDPDIIFGSPKSKDLKRFICSVS